MGFFGPSKAEIRELSAELARAMEGNVLEFVIPEPWYGQIALKTGSRFSTVDRALANTALLIIQDDAFSDLDAFRDELRHHTSPTSPRTLARPVSVRATNITNGGIRKIRGAAQMYSVQPEMIALYLAWRHFVLPAPA
jgi:hypothetical protein